MTNGFSQKWRATQDNKFLKCPSTEWGTTAHVKNFIVGSLYPESILSILVLFFSSFFLYFSSFSFFFFCFRLDPSTYPRIDYGRIHLAASTSRTRLAHFAKSSTLLRLFPPYSTISRNGESITRATFHLSPNLRLGHQTIDRKNVRNFLTLLRRPWPA